MSPNDKSQQAEISGQLARKRFVTKLVVLSEDILARLVAPLSFAGLFAALAWLGIFRALPVWLRLPLSFMLIFLFFLSFAQLYRLRLRSDDEIDAELESRNGLTHQPLKVQSDTLSNDENPVSKALWQTHKRRMAERLIGLKVGAPKVDVTKVDQYGLRAIPALLLAVSIAFLPSNYSGQLADAFRLGSSSTDAGQDLRIDAWITPPAYTNRAPVFLKAGVPRTGVDIEVPSGSILTIRSSGEGVSSVALKSVAGEDLTLDPVASAEAAGVSPSLNAQATLSESSFLTAGDAIWNILVTPDEPPTIAFQKKPTGTVNGALEIAFTAKDDWGVVKAYAEIVPLSQPQAAISLFEPPEFSLSFSRQNPKDIKATSSKDLSEHPLAGKPVSIRLVAVDGAGQLGRSPPQQIILPGKNFNDPLAASIVEQRQIFSLDVNKLSKALDYNEAIGLRADETIDKLSHYLLLQSVRGRMQLARNSEDLYDAADYLWNVALEIEDAGLTDAQRRLKDAQQNLADALERGASNEEIAKLTQELRDAMNALMQELAQRGQNQQAQPNQSSQNVLRQRDLENMMAQIENLAKSGDREAAQQLMNELQRMLNNLQMAQPRGNQQQNGQQSQADQQIEKLGEILQKQQRLMDETFKLDQQLRQQEENEQFGQQSPEGQPDENEGDQSDKQPSAQALRDQLKGLKEQQDALANDLKALQDSLSEMGIDPQEGFGKAQREMRGAGEQLGKTDGQRAGEHQGEALSALRKGAQQMMQQMMQNMQGQQSGQVEQGQANRDPLGRDNGRSLSQEYNIPDEMDVQRAREILNAIGEKLGRGELSETERLYLERLLGNGVQ